MVTKRYVKDYKFSETLAENGRIRTEAVYTGSYYRLTSPERAKAGAVRFFRAFAALWALFVGAMIPESAASRTLYVFFPYAFLAIPLWRVSASLWVLRRAGERMIRSEAEKISPRLSQTARSGAVVSGAVLASLAVMVLASPGRVQVSDLLFAVADGACFAGFLLLCRRGADFSVEEI